MRPPPDLRLPRRRAVPWRALALSAAAHVALVAAWRIEGRLPDVVHRPAIQMVTLPPVEPAPMPQMRRARDRAPGPATVATPRRRTPAAPRRTETAAPEAPSPPAAPPAAPADTGATPRGPVGRIGPSLARGHLWVRPLPLPPEELAQRLTKGHVELVDSAVTRIVQAYLDTMATDPSLRDAKLPSWTREIAGTKFGIDSGNIYIAGLKIPAAVLALLPIPATGDPDRALTQRHLQEIRRDIQQAAMRAENAAEFKTMIREMRERKEREREFQRNQRTPPPPRAPEDTITVQP